MTSSWKIMVGTTASRSGEVVAVVVRLQLQENNNFDRSGREESE
jgi:hypothetical protein